MEAKRFAIDTTSNEDEKRVSVERSKGEVASGDLIWVKIPRSSFWPAVVDDESNVSEERKPSKKSRGNVLVRLYGSYEYLYVDPIKCRSEFEIILKQNNGDCREIFRKALEQELPSEKSNRARGRGSNSKVPSNGEAVSKTTKKHEAKSNETSKKKASSSTNTGTRTPKRDGVMNGLKRKSTSTDKQVNTKNKSGRSSKKDDIVGNDMVNSADTDDETLEQVEELKEDALTPLSGKTLLAGCQALSARRMKVMQNLGLSAPSGSPFL